MHSNKKQTVHNINELFNCENLKNDVRENYKHDIIVEISRMIDNNPCTICKAEEIFDSIKYDIAKYILNHEYAVSHGVEDSLMLWLEEKSSPNKMEKLSSFFEKYIK
ncbi:MAG: hypothetical protein JW982_15550 [Spirochaetes bacterium]|nr:hypothetical protein [Spirochaetota bacterium]